MRVAAVLGVLAGCFSPHPPEGAPCDPQAPTCPDGQSCRLVAGSFECTSDDAAATDASTDAPAVATDGARIDAAVDAQGIMPIDAPHGAWTLVQTAGAETTLVHVPHPVAAGDLVVVGVETDTGVVTSVTDDGGDAFVRLDNSRATQSALGLGVELWIASDATGGAKTITAAGTTIYAVVMWEVSGIRTTGVAVDNITTLNDQPTTTTPVGAGIDTSTDGDFIVAIAIVENVVQSIATGNAFTNDHTTKGNGWAHLTAPQSPAGKYQAQWDTPTTGRYCATSVAFFSAP